VQILDTEKIRARIRNALREDIGSGDITSRLSLPEEKTVEGRFIARQSGVLAGLPVAGLVFEEVDPSIEFLPLVNDGAALEAGTSFASISGKARSILASERLSLNFLQRLSGIATLTRRFVEAVEGTRARIYDTRKTTPLWRDLEKYAVRLGGGFNHRMSLEEAVLVKDNHIKAALAGKPRQTLRELLRSIRAGAPPGTLIEVEVDDLGLLEVVLQAPPDIIMLDNMNIEEIRRAVEIIRASKSSGVQIEASGRITLENVREVAACGVDRIAVGAITHSAPALDISLELEG